LDVAAQDYEICPYATFSLNQAPPVNNSHQQTMDYCMQFQTFSQQDCYAGQPSGSSASASGQSGFKAATAANKEYYSRVRRKSNGRINIPSGDPACLPKRTSNSPPDGLSLGTFAVPKFDPFPQTPKTYFYLRDIE